MEQHDTPSESNVMKDATHEVKPAVQSAQSKRLIMNNDYTVTNVFFVFLSIKYSS